MAVIDQIELPDGSNYDIYGVNVQEISYDDYEALTPTQKNSDIAYCITDTPYEVDDSIYGEASGAIASFADGSANPLKSLVVDINPVQAGSGTPAPDNVRPISGWSSVEVTVEGKNKFDYSAVTDLYGMSNDNGVFTNTATDTKTMFEFAVQQFNGSSYVTQNMLDISTAGRYSVTFTVSQEITKLRIKHNGLTQDLRLDYPFTTQGTFTVSFTVVSANPSIVGGLSFKDVMIESGSTATSYEPYNSDTKTISLGQTVYGGKRNVTTGELTIDRAYYKYTNMNTTSGTAITDGWRCNFGCPLDDINRGKWSIQTGAVPKFSMLSTVSKGYSANDYTVVLPNSVTSKAEADAMLEGLEIVYKLATPTTVTLTPTQVSSLLGNNNIWVPCGDSDVVYITSDFIYNELRMNDTIIASNGFAYHSIESESATMAGHANTASNAQTVNGHTVNSDVPSNATFTDTTYTFANGTNGFTVTPSGGTAQTVTVTPNITNNVTGSGTSGYLAKFNGVNTVTNGVQLGSDTTKFLRNDGTWAVPSGAGGGVTGVKGDAESTYRTGNVNLTPANLGLQSKSAASGGTDLSLVTTGEKAVWDEKPSTDTKNTAGSTDTSSKIYLVGATSQAANPQTYSQDTAYVGTDGCLYSGGTKVEVVSNNAGYHNSIYRGKSLGTSITTAQWNAISAGTFDDMYIGDYWTLSTAIGNTTSNIQYVIAGFDYWWNCGDSYPQSSNKHHVVLVPATNLYSAQMNATSITTGGYIGSAMYTTNLANARTGISTLFGNHLYSVRRLFTNSVNTVGQATGWAWATSSVDLMSETMVYGHPVWTTSGFEVGVDRTILPLFALNPASASILSSWWLRSVATPSYFAYVDAGGRATSGTASASYGVRPAFAIY